MDKSKWFEAEFKIIQNKIDSSREEKHQVILAKKNN
jgi:hypothetical protein